MDGGSVYGTSKSVFYRPIRPAAGANDIRAGLSLPSRSGIESWDYTEKIPGTSLQQLVRRDAAPPLKCKLEAKPVFFKRPKVVLFFLKTNPLPWACPGRDKSVARSPAPELPFGRFFPHFTHQSLGFISFL